MTEFSLDSIQKGVQKRPLKIFLYGANGIGKTHVSGGFPSPIFMDLEDGLDGQDYPRQRIKTWEEAQGFVDFLTEENHPFQTLIIDSMDRLEKFAIPVACAQAGIDNLNKGYGQGIVTLTSLFEGFREKIDILLEQKSMHIIFVSHEKIQRIQMPGEITHDMIVPSLNDRIWPIYTDWCNIVGHAYFALKSDKTRDIGFNNKQTTVVLDEDAFASGPRLLRVNPHEKIAVSKNRFVFKTLLKDNRIDTYSIPFTAQAILAQVDHFYKNNSNTKGE